MQQHHSNRILEGGGLQRSECPQPLLQCGCGAHGQGLWRREALRHVQECASTPFPCSPLSPYPSTYTELLSAEGRSQLPSHVSFLDARTVFILTARHLAPLSCDIQDDQPGVIFSQLQSFRCMLHVPVPLNNVPSLRHDASAASDCAGVMLRLLRLTGLLGVVQVAMQKTIS